VAGGDGRAEEAPAAALAVGCAVSVGVAVGAAVSVGAVVGDGVAVGVGVEVDSAGKTALPSGQGLGGSPPATDASTRVSFGVTSFVTIETSPSAAAWVDPFCALSSRTCHPNCTGDALGLWNVQVKFDPADAGLAAAPVANVKVFGQVALTAKAACA
jgi:hypothetical protein